MIKNSILTLAVLSLSFNALAEDWTNWRGPNYNGATTGKNLPVKFSQTENVAWQTELPVEDQADAKSKKTPAKTGKTAQKKSSEADQTEFK